MRRNLIVLNYQVMLPVHFLWRANVVDRVAPEVTEWININLLWFCRLWVIPILTADDWRLE